jgi:hypothetical protein
VYSVTSTDISNWDTAYGWGDHAAAGYLESTDLGNTVVEQTSSTGSAVIPSGTEAQRDDPASAGYLRFNTDSESFEGYNGTAWGAIGGGGAASGGGGAISINNTTASESYTIDTGTNGFSVGPITILDGTVITVSDGQRWIIL